MTALPLPFLWFAAPVLAAAVMASRFSGDAWLAAVLAAPWSPPFWAWVLGWPLVLTAQAVAAWWAWQDSGAAARQGLLAWAAQWPLHVAWSWLFYAQHRPGWALPVLGLMALAAMAATRSFRRLGSRGWGLMLACSAWLVASTAWLFVTWRMSGGGWSSIFS